MNDLFGTIIPAARSPERSAILLSLVELLYDTNYSDELERINEIAAMNDAAMDCIDEVEGLIFVCTRSLCERLGLGVDYVDIRQYPQRVYQILDVICHQLEDFDDYDSLLAILESEEPNEIIVGNLVSFITTESQTGYHDILHYVQPKLVRTIKGVLNAKVVVALESIEGIDPKRVQRVIAYIKAHPLTPLTELFDNYGFLKSIDELVQHIHLAPADILGTGFIEELGTVVAGLVLASDVPPNRFYDYISDVSPKVVPDEYIEHTLEVNRVAQRVIEELLRETS